MFFFGDFGAELDVFLVFDRAVVGRDFFVCVVRLRLVTAFGLFGFLVRRGRRRGGRRQAHGLCRDGDRAENKQGEGKREERLSHRSNIGVSAILL